MAASVLNEPGAVRRTRHQMIAKRILLIQAEQVERERMTRFLNDLCYSVVQANNGAEGLALFRQGSFDLVVTDYEMPFLKGNEVASRVKRLAPWQPILMLSQCWQRPGPDNPVDISLHRCCHPKRLLEALDELLYPSQSAVAGESEADLTEREDLGRELVDQA